MIQRQIPDVSAKRRRREGGLESVEFGLFALLMTPAMLWMFIYGMNFIRYNRASDVTRSAAMLYIKGIDFMAIGNQRLVARVASGLDMQVENAGAISTSLGSGLVVLTRVQYSGASCGCTNTDKYVITQRVYVGNRNLVISGMTVEGLAGPPPAVIWNSSSGFVSNFLNDARAVVSTNFSTLWGNSLTDGQAIYVVETFFKGTSFGSGEFDARGVYTRVFM